MVDTINQTQLLLQQQQKQVEEARRQAQQIQTRERPTMAQLMQRSMQNLPAIQSQQLAAEQYKAQKISEISGAERQVARSQAEFESWKASPSGKIAQYLESGGHAKPIYSGNTLIGYRYGNVTVVGNQNISPLSGFLQGAQTSITPEQQAKINESEFFQGKPTYFTPEQRKAFGISDASTRGTISYNPQILSPAETLAYYASNPAQAAKIAIDRKQAQQQSSAIEQPAKKLTFTDKLIKSLGFGGGTTFSQLTQQYKGSPLGFVYKAPEAISSGVSSLLQKTGLSAGESKAVGESAGSTALFAFFSPLFTSAMAKKGTKTVSVEEKKAEEAVKKVSKEAAKNLIRENAIRNPDANRDIIKTILEKARETNNPEAVKNYQNVFAEVLGKQKASELFKDVSQQEGIYVRAVQPQQLQVLKPVAKPEAAKPIVEFAAETMRRQPTEYPLGVLFPSIVQAGGKAESMFAGKGTYELSSGQLPKSIISLKQPSVEMQIPKQIQPSILKMQTESQLGFRQIQPLKPIQLTQPALTSSLKSSKSCLFFPRMQFPRLPSSAL